jgi:hypothetical protein
MPAIFQFQEKSKEPARCRRYENRRTVISRKMSYSQIACTLDTRIALA